MPINTGLPLLVGYVLSIEMCWNYGLNLGRVSVFPRSARKKEPVDSLGEG